MNDAHVPLLNDDTAKKVAHRQRDRDFVEEMWSLYAPYAERDFRKKFLTQTQQHFWEMYLTCALLRQDKSVVRQPSPKKGRFGPDVKIDENGRTIWLEARAATHGVGRNAVPRRVIAKDGVVRTHDVPDAAMTLRYTAAIKDKIEKYEAYIGDCVDPTDTCVIAVSGGELDYRNTEMILPRILHALFPIGNYAVTINRETMEKVGEGHQYRDRIANVETLYFADDRHAAISAVLFSYADIHNRPTILGNDFVMVHNPFAINPLPRGWLRLGTEYFVHDGILQPPVDWGETAKHLV